MGNPNDLTSFCHEEINSATTYCKDYWSERCPRTCTYARETTEKIELLKIPEKQRTPQQVERLEHLIISTSFMP